MNFWHLHWIVQIQASENTHTLNQKTTSWNEVKTRGFITELHLCMQDNHLSIYLLYATNIQREREITSKYGKIIHHTHAIWFSQSAALWYTNVFPFQTHLVTHKSNLGHMASSNCMLFTPTHTETNWVLSQSTHTHTNTDTQTHTDIQPCQSFLTERNHSFIRIGKHTPTHTLPVRHAIHLLRNIARTYFRW